MNKTLILVGLIKYTPWVKFSSKNLHCKHLLDYSCYKIKHLVFLLSLSTAKE